MTIGEKERDDGEMTEKIRAKLIGGQEDATRGLKRKAGYDGRLRKDRSGVVRMEKLGKNRKGIGNG